MSKRTILTGIGTYVNKRGISDFGFKGDEVDVHDDFLEEFDAINVANGDGEEVVYERIGVNMVSPAAVTSEEEDETPAPKKAAAKKAT
jgi:hypothetical protein